MSKEAFFNVPRTVRETSEGPVELPILYRDVTNVLALFLAPREGAEEVLAGTGLRPGVRVGDRVLVGLSFYEYRDTSIGSYNEVGTAVFVVRADERPRRLAPVELLLPPAWRRGAVWVVDLPVTTPAADAAGRELWGYPKFVTEIPFRLDGRRFDASVLDPDGSGPIVTLGGELGPGVPAPPISLVTYSRLGGRLVRTHVDVRGLQTAHARGSVRLRVGASKHRMAAHLRALALDGAVPLLVMRTDRFQSKLHGGTVVEG
ncbi:MAG: acetoacetate decarboxylase family protein [Polyangiaceae bacterium]|nr:acetoacetate decarboxylase family protein [Polyangiaceae bacterium]